MKIYHYILYKLYLFYKKYIKLIKTSLILHHHIELQYKFSIL